MQSKKKFLLFLVFLLTLVSIAIPTATKAFQIEEKNALVPTPTPLPYTTYTSNKLGISFDYIPFFPGSVGEYWYVKEIGRTVYLYWMPGQNKPFSGSDEEFLKDEMHINRFSVEVFDKDPNLSLEENIKQKFLESVNQSECFVSSQIYSRSQSSILYQTATINIPRNAGQTRKQLESLTAKCPKYVNSFDSMRYFVTNPSNTSKLLFVSVGQSNVLAHDGLTWDKTIKIFDKN